MSHHDSALVDADWAQRHIDDPNVRFVEVDVDTEAYEESHIPGAIGWNWTSQLADGIRRDVASREDFTALLRGSGIGPDTTIVLYGDNNNWFAAWAYWQLKLFGWDDVRILDGGRKYWLANALPVSAEVPSYPETSVDLPEPDFSERAFRDDVLQHLDGGGVLVDVRSPAEFSGELLAPAALPQEGAQRAGHVPGAANIPWAPRSATTAPSRTSRSFGRSTARRASPPTRTSSRTAGSASARAIRGSCSGSSWGSSVSATTTAPGRSTAASSACRSRRT